ncbi:GntR family transcriptional regulator [Actinomadura sp. KC216]|uniref:GntR family transcriptional regulator n=1 Tax=Actinomadura sp. KC216 TaxID=2530370 RepID=UPI001FB765CF|nr:GntR family transcriptional regulator [Actinomadura sp. KC216]
MTSVDLLGPDPIYQQIAAVITARIKDGTYPPNRQIPSEAAICDEFDVSRKTAREAVRALREAGLVRTVRGKGTYVLGPDQD